jgi:hypothetical protein
MNLNTTQEEIIQHLRDIRVQFLNALEGLSEDQMIEPSIDGWSVKDHLSHLAFWHELRASEILRVTAGYDHAWPLSLDSQAVNDIVQSARSHLSLAQALWEYDSAVQKAIDAVANADERGLTQANYGEVGLRPTHDLGHADFIRNWRKRFDT